MGEFVGLLALRPAAYLTECGFLTDVGRTDFQGSQFVERSGKHSISCLFSTGRLSPVIRAWLTEAVPSMLYHQLDERTRANEHDIAVCELLAGQSQGSFSISAHSHLIGSKVFAKASRAVAATS